jgi:hypothetical protein
MTPEQAVRAGLVRAVDDAQEAGALSTIVAVPLREVMARVPVDEGIALIEDARVVFEDAGSLLQQGGDLLDRVQGALNDLLP